MPVHIKIRIPAPNHRILIRQFIIGNGPIKDANKKLKIAIEKRIKTTKILFIPGLSTAPHNSTTNLTQARYSHQKTLIKDPMANSDGIAYTKISTNDGNIIQRLQ